MRGRSSTGHAVPKPAFALNHMVAPHRGLPAFLSMARSLGLHDVEIRNDIPGCAIADGTSADDVRGMAADAGVAILSINALQRFNQWTSARAEEARRLVDYAEACGARALVMCPVNDETFMPSPSERLAGLHEALAALKPILADAGVTGLVEPLGFVECSLRLKSEAVAAIEAVDGAGTFELVHDTFHHYVAGEAEIYPDWTGLIHVSGVADPAVGVERMRDPHRVLVDARDRVDNIGQIRALLDAGYRGPVSFEPFAAEVHAMSRPEDAIRASMEFLSGRIAGTAAS